MRTYHCPYCACVLDSKPWDQMDGCGALECEKEEREARNNEQERARESAMIDNFERYR